MKYRIILLALAAAIASFPAQAQYRVVASCPGVTDFQPSGSSGGIPVVDTKGNACAGASSGSAVNLSQIGGVSANSVSTVNSTIAALGNGAVFTGTAEDISPYSSVTVSLFADQASATNGLSIQQSADGTNWDIADIYTIPASTGKTFGVQVAAKFLRVVYTNGATPQTAFRLQTIMHGFMPVTTSQRPADALSNENDFGETMAFEMVFNGTSWDRARGDATTTGAHVIVPYPTATAAGGLAPVVAGSAASSVVAKAGAGNLYSAYATCTAACWLMAFNATSLPANGATTAGVASGNLQDCVPIASGGLGSISVGGGPPEVFTVGITLAISSTACATLTAATTGFIHASAK